MKRPTNAVLLGPAHPYRGGLADFDHLLARALNRAGIPCRLYTFTLQYPSFLFPGKSQFTDAPAPEGLDITRVLNSVNPLNWIRTGLRIRRERPDLLIVRYWLPQMAPALGTVCRIARRGGTRTVAIMDNVLPHESRPMDRLLTRYMTGSLDGFVYMSREIRAQLDLFDRTKPSVFSPHPMYTGYGDPLPREQACGELGLDPSCRYAMFFGYIRDYKGLDLLLNAWALLRRRGGLDGRHKLIVAGEYYSGRERYAEQIDRLGIRDSLVMMDRFIAEDEVGKLFSAARRRAESRRSPTGSTCRLWSRMSEVWARSFPTARPVWSSGPTRRRSRKRSAVFSATGFWNVSARISASTRSDSHGSGWSKTSERFTNRSKRERTKRTAEHHSYLPPAGQTDSRKKRTPHKGVRVVLACRRHESALGSGGPKTPVPSRSERCLPGYLSDGNDLTPDPGKKRRRPPLRNKPFAQAVTETPAAGRHGQTIARRTKCRSDSHRKAGRLHGIPYRAILRNLLFFKTGIAGALSAKRTETGAPNAPQNAGRTVRTIGRKDPN